MEISATNVTQQESTGIFKPKKKKANEVKPSLFQDAFKDNSQGLNEDGSGVKVTQTIDKDGNVVETVEKYGEGGVLLQRQERVTTPDGKLISVNDTKNETKAATTDEEVVPEVLKEEEQVQPEKEEVVQELVQEKADNKPNYKVKSGESYTSIIKSALESQGVETSKENVVKAKDQFKKANPNSVKIYNGKHKEWHGNEFLYVNTEIYIPKFDI